ncbi:MAG: 30S ribosomal protein S4 [Waddliaceae bacterium]|nr:30S ribosomal protein S4 [Waddliaceae bacterium]
MEKQKLKAVYGMLSEKQLRRYYQEAFRVKEPTAHHLLRLLECRLDVIVYKLGFASTIFGAHQLVAHGHIHVNGKKVDRRSFQVQPGMIISVREKSKNMKAVKQSLELNRTVPEYLSCDTAKMSGQLMALPDAEQISFPLEINVPVVCEFLAHTT